MHTSDLSADEIIALLGLLPHPEGGHYVETYRSPPELAGARPHGTAIYFLLRSGQRSHWHRVDADEMWHHYAGAELELLVAEPGQTAAPCILGKDLSAGARPQRLVPRGHWQAARSLGDWTLVGCTVTPAFEFAGFELAPADFEPSAVGSQMSAPATFQRE